MQGVGWPRTQEQLNKIRRLAMQRKSAYKKPNRQLRKGKTADKMGPMRSAGQQSKSPQTRQVRVDAELNNDVEFENEVLTQMMKPRATGRRSTVESKDWNG
jgi:hypothetical protein